MAETKAPSGRKCSACGKTGHRAPQCPTPAAWRSGAKRPAPSSGSAAIPPELVPDGLRATGERFVTGLEQLQRQIEQRLADVRALVAVL